MTNTDDENQTESLIDSERLKRLLATPISRLERNAAWAGRPHAGLLGAIQAQRDLLAVQRLNLRALSEAKHAFVLRACYAMNVGDIEVSLDQIDAFARQLLEALDLPLDDLSK